MRRCLDCNAVFACSSDICPACASSPALLDGFRAYASQLADAASGFKAAYFQDLARLEDGHFWFESRNALIFAALRRCCPDFRSFLEIGCGTGYVLSGIAQAFPNAALSGSEIFAAGLACAASRVPSANFMQMDARDIPFVDEFDVIGAFDVLEHIEEDAVVLSQVRAALKPGGHVILTVPQHRWLWSALDEYACHVRRYPFQEIRQKIEAAGFEIVRTTSFVTTLLPAMMMSRFRKRSSSTAKLDAAAEFRIAPFLNAIFQNMLKLEIAAFRGGMSLPLGGSRLVVARKTS